MSVVGRLDDGWLHAVRQSGSGWLVALAYWLLRGAQLGLLSLVCVHDVVLQPLCHRLRLDVVQAGLVLRILHGLVFRLLRALLQLLLWHLLRRGEQLL